MVSIITTLNAAYDITEGRPWWKVRLTAIGADPRRGVLHPGVAGSWCSSDRRWPSTSRARCASATAFKWAWWILQWPVVLALVATGIGLIYYFAPDAEQEWVWITPGSVVATVLWLLVSLGFKVYISYFGNYNETYGTHRRVIVLLTWFYLSGLAILFGAEMNAEIEHASPYGKDTGEKVAGREEAHRSRGAARLRGEAEGQGRAAGASRSRTT